MWRRFKVVHHAVDEVEPGDRDDEEDGIYLMVVIMKVIMIEMVINVNFSSPNQDTDFFLVLTPQINGADVFHSTDMPEVSLK